MPKSLVLFLAAGVAAACASPETDVRNGLEALRHTSFSWETTVRHRASVAASDADAGAPLPADLAIAVRGRSDQRFTEITLLPDKAALPVPVTAYIQAGAAAGETPLGWMTRREMDEMPADRANTTVTLAGKPVRVYRAVAAAERAIKIPDPLDEVFELLADIKSYREVNGDPVGDLTEHAIETLWGDPSAKRAPEIAGFVTFRLSNGVLTEYRYRLEIGFASAGGQSARRSIVQWSTRIDGIGTTTINPPRAALEKL
jgi:hypothetical protein